LYIFLRHSLDVYRPEFRHERLVTSANQRLLDKLRAPCLCGAGVEMRFPGTVREQALGHNSKAVHRAYAKHAEVAVPSLDGWEKDWQENPQRSVQSKLLPVGFRAPLAAIAQSN
jgi:hypothetical protein